MELQALPETFAFFVRQASPRILVIVSAGFLIARIATRDWRLADFCVAIAVAASWHLQERILHEYFLHQRVRYFLGATLAKRLGERHRHHHRDPWRTQTLFIATAAYPFLLPSVFGVLFATTRDIRLTLTGSFAYFFTLLCYEWVHLLIHTSYVPRSDWYRRRWWNHRLHHFKNQRHWFGITSAMWDTVFGSRPDPSHVEILKDWRGPNPIE